MGLVHEAVNQLKTDYVYYQARFPQSFWLVTNNH